MQTKLSVEAEKARASAAAAAPPAPYASTRQAAFHALLNTYADVTFPDRAPLGSQEERDEMMDAYLLHAVAHVDAHAQTRHEAQRGAAPPR